MSTVTLPACPVCGAAPGGSANGGGGGGSVVTLGGFSDTELAALAVAIPLLARWFRAAKRKHAFGFACTSNPNRVPFSTGRLGTLIVPAQNIWVGSDATVSVAANSVGAGNAGLPVAANAVLSFGEEEGDSETWLVTTATLSPVDVRCLELLP